MTVLELKKELDKLIENGYGDLPCIIYQGHSDGDFGYDTKHDVTDLYHYTPTSYWKEHIEIGQSYRESEAV